MRVVDLVAMVLVRVRSVVVTGLEAEGGLLSLIENIGRSHGRQEGCCQEG